MRKFSLYLLLFLVVFSCAGSRKYTDYDISYARSGGKAAVYENLLIRGKNIFYSYEAADKKYTASAKLTPQELQQIYGSLEANNFAKIEEDHRKIFDNVTTSIIVKNGTAGKVNDGSGIMPADVTRWENIKAVFRKIIKDKNFER